MRFATSLTLLALTGTAWGQAALDESGKPTPTVDPNAAPNTLSTSPQLEYGADFRIRRVYVPKALLNLFVEKSGAGAANTGFGVDLVRRRGDLELQLGFEFEHVQPGEGVWINSGDNVAGGDEAD